MGVEDLRSGASVIERDDRGVLHFKGEQAVWFLDQLVTNKVEDLEPGDGAESLLLTPNGRIVAPMRLIRAGQSVHADVDRRLASHIKDFFEGRIFATKVEIADRSNEFAIFTVIGPDCDNVVAEAMRQIFPSETREHQDLGAEMPVEKEHHTVHFGSSVVTRLIRPVRGVDVWVRRDIARDVNAALSKAGAREAQLEDFNRLCTIEGLPRFGIDYDDSYLPQEAALERTVHFAKGCYLGQEAVAMTQRGRVKRRLRHLHFDGEAISGILKRDGAEVGSLGSFASEKGRGFAVATVKTSVELGSEVDVVPSHEDARKAIVKELPNTTTGPSVPSARELRERLKE